MAESKKFIHIGTVSISPDHKLVAFTIDEIGNEQYSIYVFDTQKCEYYPNIIRSTTATILWHEYINGFFYISHAKNWRHLKVMFHHIRAITEDVQIFEEKDASFHVSIKKSRSNEYIFIYSQNYSCNELFILSLRDANFSLKSLKSKRSNIFYIFNKISFAS